MHESDQFWTHWSEARKKLVDDGFTAEQADALRWTYKAGWDAFKSFKGSQIQASAKILLKPEEVALLLRVSKRTIWRMYDRGELEGNMLGGTDSRASVLRIPLDQPKLRELVDVKDVQNRIMTMAEASCQVHEEDCL